MPLLIGAMVLFMWSSQRKQKRKAADLLASMEVGDEVVTNGGIFGVINFIEDGVVHLEVDNDVVIRVSQAAIGRKIVEADVDDTESSATK